MDSINYNQLYKLQDKVLDLIFSTEQTFYLTGGTALSRFYIAKRYSDDLDFFIHNSREFVRSLRNIKYELDREFHLDIEVDSKDFVRLRVDKILQVDFVNDGVMRYKEPKYLENGYIIDNYENILANKITAVIGRDNPKDIFDIFLIYKNFACDWKSILEVAHKKAGFSDDDLIIRLKTFPPALLKSIKLIDTTFLDNFKEEYNILIKKIESVMMQNIS